MICIFIPYASIYHCVLNHISMVTLSFGLHSTANNVFRCTIISSGTFDYQRNIRLILIETFIVNARITITVFYRQCELISIMLLRTWIGIDD